MLIRKKTMFVSMEAKYQKLKRKFYIVMAILVLLIIANLYYIYLNYDYLAFKHLISQNYIYTDSLDKLFERELKRDVNGQYYKYFDNLVISIVTREIREEQPDPYTYQYLPEQYKKSKENEKKKADQSYVDELDENIVYLKLTNYSKHTKNFVKNEKETLEKYTNIIIDLRDNPGGDVFALNYIADLFLPEDNIISYDNTRSKLFSKTVKSKKKKQLSYDKIIILQNNDTASSAEGFIAALKDNLDNVILIGDNSYGKGTGQIIIPLKKNFAVKATTMFWNTPKNQNVQGTGIEPDIRYTEDDIIEYAVKYIKEK